MQRPRRSRPRSRRRWRQRSQVDGVTEVTGYAQTLDDRFISKAGDAAYVLIGLDVDEDRSIALVEPVEHALALPAGYTVALTGFGPIQLDSQRLSEADLLRAETVSLPIAALVLILVFGSLIAAGMPLLVAGLAIPSSIGLIGLVAQQTEMSIYVLNIATMLGLALAIDYSLFLTSRFREELARGRTVEQAVERAVAHGRQGRPVLRRRGRDRAVRPPLVQGQRPELDRPRRGASSSSPRCSTA